MESRLTQDTNGTTQQLTTPKRRRKAGWAGAALFLALLPGTASAHVKYFEDHADFPLNVAYVLSWRTALALACIFLAVTTARFVEHLIRTHGQTVLEALPSGPVRWVQRTLQRMAVGAPAVLAMNAGISLVFAATSGALLVPHLRIEDPALAWALTLVQGIIALSFISGVGDWLGALALAGLWLLGVALFPAWDLLEQAQWLGIAAMLLIVGRTMTTDGRARSWFRERTPGGLSGRVWANHAVTLLRVSAGAAILLAALGEKLWNPDLGATFIAGRPWFNVLRAVPGLEWVSDDLFVLVIGLGEATIGALLISGALPRLVVLGALLPFQMGLPFLPVEELMGHLPFFGIMYIILVHSTRPARIVITSPRTVPSRGTLSGLGGGLAGRMAPAA